MCFVIQLAFSSTSGFLLAAWSPCAQAVASRPATVAARLNCIAVVICVAEMWLSIETEGPYLLVSYRLIVLENRTL